MTCFVFAASADSAPRPDITGGIYEDNGHFYIITDEGYASQEVLKSFYGFWYDGIYDVEDANGAYLAQIDDTLYLEWWHREDFEENKATGGVFWAPGSNVRELALTPYPVKDRLSGWFIVRETEDEEPLVFEILYWQADVECTDELASFTLPDGATAYVSKHIQIGDVVYTCAAGRRKVVRNPALKASLPGTPQFSDGGVIMVLDAPYLVKSEITDLQAEIDAHNSIIYPPRFSTMDIREPSIYKKLEEMPIQW